MSCINIKIILEYDREQLCVMQYGKEERMNGSEAMQQGKAYLESGEYELAAEAFTEAIRLDPQNAPRITAAAMRTANSIMQG